MSPIPGTSTFTGVLGSAAPSRVTTSCPAHARPPAVATSSAVNATTLAAVSPPPAPARSERRNTPASTRAPVSDTPKGMTSREVSAPAPATPKTETSPEGSTVPPTARTTTAAVIGPSEPPAASAPSRCSPRPATPAITIRDQPTAATADRNTSPQRMRRTRWTPDACRAVRDGTPGREVPYLTLRVTFAPVNGRT